MPCRALYDTRRSGHRLADAGLGRWVGVGGLLIWAAVSPAWAPAQLNENEPADGPNPVVEGQVLNHSGGGLAKVAVRLVRKDSSGAESLLAEVETNPFGEFTIELDPRPTGDLEVVFRKEGYVEQRRKITVSAEGWPPFLDLTLSGARVATGSVRAASSGEAVAGADVVLNVAGEALRAETDGEGRFRLEGVPPNVGTLVVTADGFARLRVPIVKPTADDAAIEVSLKPERIVRLRVLDAQSRGVAEAQVSCLVELEDDKDIRSGATDDEGVAVFRHLSRGVRALRVRVSHPRFVSDSDYDREIDVPPDRFDSLHEIRLMSAGSVSGVVTRASDGAPLNGARVTVHHVNGADSAREWTDFDGRFSIAAARPGQSFVVTYLNGFAPRMDERIIEAGQTVSIEIALEPAKRAGGVVVDQHGEPVAGAMVCATAWRSTPFLGAQTLTGGDGRFILENLPPDGFEIRVTAPGCDPLERQWIKPGTMDHEFVVRRRPEREPGDATKPTAALKADDPFPDLELTTIDGVKIRTRDLRGKIVLVDFWATWCGPCVVEIPNLVRVREAFGSRDDFLLVGISLDAEDDAGQKKLRRFLKKRDMTWPQVVGTSGGADLAADTCGVKFIPQTFLVGPDGKIVAVGLLGEPLKARIGALLKESKD